jgi:hypothetical protein
MAWADTFYATQRRVHTELDTSMQLRRLDVAIVNTDLHEALPDGVDNLAMHNLFTYKSHHEALTPHELDEVVSHKVGYCKANGLVEPTPQQLRLFAVTARFPSVLGRGDSLQFVRHGVYDVRYPSGWIRVLVIAELPLTPNNAMLHLFSANPDAIAYGQQHYRPRSPHTSHWIYELFRGYQGEGIPMSITLEEYARQVDERIINNAPVERRLAGLTPEQRLAGLAPDQLLNGLSADQLAELIRLANQKQPPK